VVFAGGEGLLLLIQPASIDAATSKLASTFIIASLNMEHFDEFTTHRGCHSPPRVGGAAAADRACACPRTSYTGGNSRLGGEGSPSPQPYTVLGASQYWIYGRAVGA